MSRKLQLKRGTKAKLPTLAEGEPGFVTDEKKLYIGTGTENVPMARDADLIAHTGNKSNPHGATAAQVGAVPTTRKVNNKALSADISLTAADVGADPAGSAAAVGTKLTSHIGDTVKHITAAERTAWAGKAERKTATGTLSTAGWTGSAGNWSQAVTVSWMLAADVPKARLTGTTAAQMDAWDTLEPYVDSAAGKVTFYCKQAAKPSAAMSVGIEVIR